MPVKSKFPQKCEARTLEWMDRTKARATLLGAETAVGFGLADQGEARRHAEEGFCGARPVARRSSRRCWPIAGSSSRSSGRSHRLCISGSDRACDKWLEGYRVRFDDIDLQYLYRAIAWLGEELADQEGRTRAPRAIKDLDVGSVARPGFRAERTAVPVDDHADHHLFQFRAVILGLAAPSERLATPSPWK